MSGFPLFWARKTVTYPRGNAPYSGISPAQEVGKTNRVPNDEAERARQLQNR